LTDVSKDLESRRSSQAGYHVPGNKENTSVEKRKNAEEVSVPKEKKWPPSRSGKGGKMFQIALETTKGPTKKGK